MRKFALLVLFLFIGNLLLPNSAEAHAGVVSTFPSQDEVVTVMPTEIKIVFSEELMTITDKEINTISLIHFDGPPVEINDVRVSGATLSANVPSGDYESGIYKVRYRIVSADGHKVSDSFTFSLNAPVTTAALNVEADGDGVLPLPIVGAIAIVVILGGYLALRARNRKL
jgi:methionine-rich copper-binding protein CopC